MPDKRLLILAGVIVALLFAAVLSAPYRSIQGPEVKAHQRAEHSERSGSGVARDGASAAAVPPGVHPAPANGVHQQEAERRREPSAEGESGFLGTSLSADAAVAIFTLLLCVVTGFLYKATRDLVNESRRTAERQLRPYVVLKPFIHTPALNEIDGRVRSWSFRCVWHNVGSTPTKYATTRVGLLRNFGDKPLNFRADTVNMVPGQLGRLFLGPGNEASSEKFDIDVEDMFMLLTGAVEIYFWGCINYSDNFIKAGRHRTEFCAKIVVVGDPQLSNCGIGYEMYGPFNGIDGECYAQPETYDPNLFR